MYARLRSWETSEHRCNGAQVFQGTDAPGHGCNGVQLFRNRIGTVVTVDYTDGGGFLRKVRDRDRIPGI